MHFVAEPRKSPRRVFLTRSKTNIPTRKFFFPFGNAGGEDSFSLPPRKELGFVEIFPLRRFFSPPFLCHRCFLSSSYLHFWYLFFQYLCVVFFWAMNLSLVFLISSISLVDIAWTRPPFEEHKLLSRNLHILSTLLARDNGMIGSLNQCGTVGVMSHKTYFFPFLALPPTDTIARAHQNPQGVCVHTNLCPSDVSFEGACPHGTQDSLNHKLHTPSPLSSSSSAAGALPSLSKQIKALNLKIPSSY